MVWHHRKRPPLVVLALIPILILAGHCRTVSSFSSARTSSPSFGAMNNRRLPSSASAREPLRPAATALASSNFELRASSSSSSADDFVASSRPPRRTWLRSMQESARGLRQRWWKGRGERRGTGTTKKLTLSRLLKASVTLLAVFCARPLRAFAGGGGFGGSRSAPIAPLERYEVLASC